MVIATSSTVMPSACSSRASGLNGALSGAGCVATRCSRLRARAEAAGWGQSVKSVQRMPTPRPRNTEHYSSQILSTPAGVPTTAVPTDPAALEGAA